MSDNLFAQFKRLIAGAPMVVGEVVAVSGGTVTVELPDGGRLRALGTAALGATVFVRDGRVEGAAPDLPVTLVEL